MGALPTPVGAAEINNWAVIVSSSSYWHNYRHAANALSMYHAARGLGLPDGRIVLMLAGGGVPCDARNAAPGSVFNTARRETELYATDVQIDYRGADVSVANLLGVLTDTVSASVPASRRLRSSATSRVLVYLAGHGGDEFFKFRDVEEMAAAELSAAIGSMWALKRYGELVLVVDTCQAESMSAAICAPAVVSIASSARGESSYSLGQDNGLGVALVDRFTHALHQFLRSAVNATSFARLRASLLRDDLLSTIVVGGSVVAADDLELDDFFGFAPASLVASEPAAIHAAERPHRWRCTPRRAAAWRQSEGRALSVGGVPLADWPLPPPRAPLQPQEPSALAAVAVCSVLCLFVLLARSLPKYDLYRRGATGSSGSEQERKKSAVCEPTTADNNILARLSRWTLIWTRSTIRMPRRFALRCAPSTTTLRRGCCQRLRLHGCVASTASFSLSWRNARQMRRSSRLWAALARLVSVAAAARAEVWQRGLCCRHRKWSLYHCKWSLYRRRSLSPIG